MVDTPTPETVAAGASVLASKWNTHVRDLADWTVANIGGVGARNGLYNSHFDIWQRGTSFAITSSATPQYTADRWCTRRSGATGATVSRRAATTGQQYVMRIARDNGNSSTTAIETWQALDTPDSARFAGTTCQLRIRLKAGANFSAASSAVTIKLVTGEGTNESPATTWTGSYDALSESQQISATEDDYIFDGIELPWDATQIKAYVAFTPVGTAGANDWVEIHAIQLVEGSAPGWERLPVGEHLMRCQRYYYALPLTGADGAAYSASSFSLLVVFPTAMRVAPTLTAPAGTYGVNHYAIGNATSTTPPTAASVATTKCILDFGGFSGLTVHRGGSMYTHPGLAVSAEL